MYLFTELNLVTQQVLKDPTHLTLGTVVTAVSDSAHSVMVSNADK